MSFKCTECETPVVDGHWSPKIVYCPNCEARYLAAGDSYSMKFLRKEMRDAQKGMYILWREDAEPRKLFDVQPATKKGEDLYVAIEGVGHTFYLNKMTEWLSDE